MTTPDLADAVAPIACGDRSDRDESLHHGIAVAVDAGGRPVAAVGDPRVAVYPRSSLKPFQVAAMCASGLDLESPLLALACASHDGSDEHVAGVRRILERYGLHESALRNTSARPFGAAARTSARRRGIGPSPIQQNCSGKHAAMLATCRVNGWDIGSYLDPDHPLQRAITDWIEQHGCTVEHVGVDGCGAPTHYLHLDEVAVAIGRLAASDSPVPRAMSAHPAMVAGPDRDVTRWMRAVDGLIAKDGALGVMVVARDDGRAAAFKIADGSDQARQAVTIEAVRQLGVDVEKLGDLAVPPAVLGHGHAVGALRALNWGPCSS